jgi:tetratricopeptide (TPR) repeat protein
LFPLLEGLRRAARSKRRGEPSAILEAVREFLPGDSEQTKAAVALLAELLALPVDAPCHDADIDAKRRRASLFEAIVDNLHRLAGERPVLILVEDAHWIDATSRELMEFFVGRMSQSRVLLVVTCRPEYHPAWQGEHHTARIDLKPISPRAAESLIKRLSGAASLPDALVKDIAARADGIPLFIEELTKAVLEGATVSGPGNAARLTAPAIPSTLHASLTARLDRLGKSREVARVAAALGREFPSDLLLEVVPDYTADALQDALQQLVHTQLLSPSESSARSYAFRHALIQDAAYGTLPRDERKALHRRIAIALHERFAETVAAEPEIVAGHFTKGGLAEPAIKYWTEAGNRAVRGSALLDAAKHFSEAIRLVRELSPSPERDRTELELHLLLGPVIMAVKGYASQDTLTVFARARELAAPSSTPAQQLDILAGLFNVHYGRAELEQAQAVARQHLAIAEAHRQEEARAHCFMGQVYLAQGAFGDARAHFERTLAIFAECPEDTRNLGVYGSQYVVATAFLAGVYWALGEPEKAAASTASSIEYANGSGHLVSIALALITRLLSPIPGGLKGDPAEAEEALEFCTRHGLSNFELWARFAHGAILARRGAPQDGIRVMQGAIDKAEGMGSRLFRPVQLATLASAYARLNDMGKALALMDEAIAAARQTGERRADSALHRLRGELLIATRRFEEGRQDLLRALEIAEAQQAISEVDRTQKAIRQARGAGAAA